MNNFIKLKSIFIIYIGFFDNVVNGKFSKMIFDIVKIMIKNKYIKMILEYFINKVGKNCRLVCFFN